MCRVGDRGRLFTLSGLGMYMHGYTNTHRCMQAHPPRAEGRFILCEVFCLVCLLLEAAVQGGVP